VISGKKAVHSAGWTFCTGNFALFEPIAAAVSATSASKVRVPAAVGNPNRSSTVYRHRPLELIAGYHSDSFTGPN
jgi:hypothetical protein